MQQPVQIVPAVQSPGSGPGSVQNVLQANTNNLAVRDDRWSEAIAVGSLAFVETVKNDLGVKARHRDVIEADESYALCEPSEAYAERREKVSGTFPRVSRDARRDFKPLTASVWGAAIVWRGL